MFISEDAVRDGHVSIDGLTFIKGAKQLLGLDIPEEGVAKGTGQITTFKQLGFSCKNDNHKPDGWYLPVDLHKVALVLETKNSDEELTDKRWELELLKNIEVLLTKYTKVIGILYNGSDIRVFKNKEEISDGLAPTLQNTFYYIKLFNIRKLPKQKIYETTSRINDALHYKFGIQDLQERMIFTACALVAQRFFPKNGLQRLKGMGFSIFQNWIYNTLAKVIENDKKQSMKLDILLEEYSSIRMSIADDQNAIDSFIDDVCEIAELVNSDNWNGEDVMAIFFNEFNRYRKKADAGQILTPDHITSFMYRLLNVNMNDRVLDATCGSGAFLVKSMCNMIKEAGGTASDKAKVIKSEQLYGIEMYRKMFALACANMMIHKDGKTNIAQMDARSDDAKFWIKTKGVTKVLMNPPYERKHQCMKIVENVLSAVPVGTLCAFIMPDKKLEIDGKDKRYGNKLLKKHHLTTIIKLPEDLFFGVGVTTSIFIFESGMPQNSRNVIGYYVENDGLETVKNKGRQDVRNKWDDIEEYWIKAIRDGNDYLYNTRQIIDPSKHISYQCKKQKFTLSSSDFFKSIMDLCVYENGGDLKEQLAIFGRYFMYSTSVVVKNINHNDYIYNNNRQEDIDTKSWIGFRVGDLFDIHPTNRYRNSDGTRDMTNIELFSTEGINPVVVNSSYNNGVGGYTKLDTTEKGNIITFSDTVDANTIFYQEHPFVGYPHVQGLYSTNEYSERWTKYSLLFFMCIFRRVALQEGFDFGNKFRRDIAIDLVVPLPVIATNEPDWSYMEQFMMDIEKLVITRYNYLMSLCHL